MNFAKRRSNSALKYALLLGSASLTTMVAVGAAQAQDAAQAPSTQAPLQQVAQANTPAAPPPNMPISEEVLVTGSLIHGAAAVGVPVTSLGDADFKQTGAITIGQLFLDVPAVYEIPQNDVQAGGGYISRDENVNLRNLSMRNSRQLLLVDGIQFPNQGAGGCQTDPSIIPQLAAERIDLLTDGASATYGSSAVTGVINVIMKRGFDGAITQVQFGASTDIGHAQEEAAQLFGRTWDGGDITLSYDWYNQAHTIGGVRPYFTANFFTYTGVDDRMALINADPGIISLGTPATFTGSGTAGAPAGFTATIGTSCTNCYAIPDTNGLGLTWSQILANNPTSTAFTQNLRNVYLDAWTEPNQQRTAETLTFDQKVATNISFFADAFNDNREALLIGVGTSISIQVPTNNIYYPTGAPSNIKVNYDFSPEYLALGGVYNSDRVTSQEIDARYDLGFNINLPFDWLGKIYGAQTLVKEISATTGTVNSNMVTAALGGTVAAVNASPAQPYTIGSFTKPSNIPYLNLFCDPLEYTCNSLATLNYISGYSFANESEIIDQFGLNADGPVYDLPGGTIKAAVGAVYQRWAFNQNNNASNATTTAINNQTIQAGSRGIYSVFGQVNIPLVGNNFTLPLVQGFNIEAAIRYDKYTDVGATTNPKISADWEVGAGLTLRGSFGTSFRAPEFQEEVQGGPGLINLSSTGTLSGSNQTCPTIGATPVAGTIASDVAAGVPGSTQFYSNSAGNCPQYLYGLSTGSNQVIQPGYHLQPETAQNLDLGFEFAPTDGFDSFLKGFDLQATYWYLRIRNVINNYYGVAGFQSGELDNPIWTHTFYDPENDPNFEAQVVALLSGPHSTLSPTLATYIQFMSDTMTRNIGWQAVNGIDFQASYDWDMGDWGAWNTGVTGTYNIDNKSQGGPGQVINSIFTTPQNSTNTATDTGGRMKYRARLGWADDGGWSVTTFMNFIPHANSDTAVLPPSCFIEGNTPCNAYGNGAVQFAEYSKQFPSLSNYVPGIYTFDLSIGYKTGDKPANEYLKNLGVQLTISNILDKQAPYAYQISPPSGQVRAYYSTTQGTSLGIDGRVVSLVLTKTW